MTNQTATTNQTLMSTIFSDCQKRRHNMVYQTAKKVSGRALSKMHEKQNQIFDWDAFNKEFDKQYGNWTTEQLANELINNVYYITCMSDIVNLYFRYQEESNNRRNNKPAKPANSTLLQFAKAS